MFALPPLAFVKNNEHAAIIVIHVGRSLCGHDGIIHGGLLATVLDESLGRNVSLVSESTPLDVPLTGSFLSNIGVVEYPIQNRRHGDPECAIQEANKS